MPHQTITSHPRQSASHKHQPPAHPGVLPGGGRPLSHSLVQRRWRWGQAVLGTDEGRVTVPAGPEALRQQGSPWPPARALAVQSPYKPGRPPSLCPSLSCVAGSRQDFQVGDKMKNLREMQLTLTSFYCPNVRAPLPAQLHLHGEDAVDPVQPRAAGRAHRSSRAPGARRAREHRKSISPAPSAVTYPLPKPQGRGAESEPPGLQPASPGCLARCGSRGRPVGEGTDGRGWGGGGVGSPRQSRGLCGGQLGSAAILSARQLARLWQSGAAAARSSGWACWLLPSRK